MRACRTALAGLFLLATLTGCSPEQAPLEKLRPVRTLIVTPVADGEELVQTGEIQPRYETAQGFRIDGRIASRLVDVGARVKAGQTIATLDDRDVQNELRAADADMRSAAAAEDLAKVALERQQTLFAKDIVAKARVDEAEANWQSARSRREAAVATLANARNKLAYTKLTAENDGIITSIGANAGQVVAAGQMVATLASTNEREAVFNVAETLVQGAPHDLQVKVSLSANPAISVVGTVREISPTADPVTRTFRVRISLPGAPADMAFGATVTGSVVLPTGLIIAVPAASITNDGDKPAVYVVDPATGLLVRKPVTIARYTADTAYVAAGLDKGDIVVTAGVAKLRPGQKVLLEGVAK
ncbi:efflux RND transporter periplasmic adaptor subunit [Asticcacaulis sp.]|uniref:efflux RND transporter periplasmic adaptor subunit n=1 Tax=Asticcacaulis sp. TaxID=1872648 RepID=UPI0026297982|nr:efflux RND transporter periplasmic adaptor subunit [Asticcacaulis sp.]